MMPLLVQEVRFRSYNKAEIWKSRNLTFQICLTIGLIWWADMLGKNDNWADMLGKYDNWADQIWPLTIGVMF